MNSRLILICLCLGICFPATKGFAQYYGSASDIPEASWSLGVILAGTQLDGDVQAIIPGIGGGIFGQKTITRVLDLRIMYLQGLNRGQDLSPSDNFGSNPALNGTYNPELFYDSSSLVFHNYRLRSQDLSAQFKLNVNRMFAPTGGEDLDVYLSAGVGVQLYQTFIDAFDGLNRKTYDYSTIPLDDPLVTRQALQDLSDGTYETWGQRDLLNDRTIRNNLVNTVFVLGGGIRYQLSSPIALGLDFSYLFTGDDLLDGQQWQTNDLPTGNSDKLMRIGISFDYTLE
jgi:opacity protein-like surface antigen